jgi:flavin-dependent dehydrogenase
MIKDRYMKKVKSPDKDKWYDLELRADRYVRIPKNFIKKIELDSERNIVMKSNNNVWFFKIRDQNEENEIAEEVKVNVDKKWGFTVPLMYYQKDQVPGIYKFLFFDDENGVGCGYGSSYFIWANGKLGKERFEKEGANALENLDDHIREVLKKIREKE